MVVFCRDGISISVFSFYVCVRLISAIVLHIVWLDIDLCIALWHGDTFFAVVTSGYKEI